MNILLINPSCLADAGRDLYSAHLLGPLFTLQPFRRMTLGLPLALPTLAALTPPGHSVRIVDEEIEEIDFAVPVDLVGITAMSFKATRAYQIAAQFRRRGVKVVMGGIHASMAPDEVAGHVDAVVIGEAEELWPQLLADAEAGRLQPRYQATAFPDLARSPVPRYDLVKCRSYLYSYLQTTRGCPFACDFCTVTRMSGRRLRRKSIEQVLAEVDRVLAQQPMRPFRITDRSSGRNRRFVGAIAFIDDNFAIDRQHALEVCTALLDYQRRHDLLFFWYTQVNYTVGFDAELLAAMAESGCRHLFIGFESLDPDVLAGMNKEINDPARYAGAIRNIEQAGMRVVYSTIFGNDGSGAASVDQLVRFVEEQRIFHVLLNILTPYPGTALHAAMAREGRILTDDPQLYNIRNVVYRPAGMTTVDLEAMYMSLCRQLYRFERVYARGQGASRAADRFALPPGERMGVWLGLLLSGALMATRGRLRWRSALHLWRGATRDILGNGSLAALEVLLASCDYEDFLVSEMTRMGRRDGGRRAGLATALITPALRTVPLPRQPGAREAEYRAFYVGYAELARHGVTVPPAGRGRPVLVLGGSSISLADRKDFLGHLLYNGFEVAGIENPIGGISDVRIDPVRERPEALRHFLKTLRSERVTSGIDIVAQSYAAFEVVRILTEEPDWASFVRSIILINPPGFDRHNNVVRHSARFLFGHVLGGYAKSLKRLARLRWTATGAEKDSHEGYCRREISGISFWTMRTFVNPVRTLRELKDIVGFRIREQLCAVINQGTPVYLFLQADDKVVPPGITIAETKRIIPEQRITVTPGGHNDLFFQTWQRDTFCEILNRIRHTHHCPE